MSGSGWHTAHKRCWTCLLSFLIKTTRHANQKSEAFITRLQVRGTSESIVICRSYKCTDNRNFNDGIMILAPTQYLLLTLKTFATKVSNIGICYVCHWFLEVRTNLCPWKSNFNSKHEIKSGSNQIWHIPPSQFFKSRPVNHDTVVMQEVKNKNQTSQIGNRGKAYW